MPLAVTLFVEKGLRNAVVSLCYMFLSGGPMYFIFHIQTRCHYFLQTLLAGNAKYRPTGRGFVITHASFDENFRFFASSHLYFGFELGVMLILYGLHSDTVDVDLYMGDGWLNAHSNDLFSVIYGYLMQVFIYFGETWCLW